METQPSARPIGSRRSLIALALIVVVFLALRLVFLAARDPFFDELFTRWVSAQPFGSMIEALRHDSGPPLYYALIHLLGTPDVPALRLVSLLFAGVSLLAILRAGWMGEGRLIAAALLAVYPPAVVFAVDARAYALCAMCVALGVLALARARTYASALAFVAAAYSHYYGVLFFPLLLAAPLVARRRLRRADAIAFAAAVLAFVPALLLALQQPKEATAWFAQRWPSLLDFGFISIYPTALFATAPRVLIVAAFVVTVGVLSRMTSGRAAGGEWQVGEAGNARALFATATLIPIAGIIVLALLGRPAYFSMRFASVLAAPFALWLAASLMAWPRRVRMTLLALLLIAGGVASYIGVVDAMQRPIDPYRQAALALRDNAWPTDRIVASGFLYLESRSALGPRVMPFGAEQGEHPGWRARPPASSEAPPAEAFLWIGERGAPELRLLRRTREVRPLFMNERAIVVRVGPAVR